MSIDDVVLLGGEYVRDAPKAPVRKPRLTPRRVSLGMVGAGGALTVAGVGLVFVPAALVLAGIAFVSLGLLGLRELGA